MDDFDSLIGNLPKEYGQHKKLDDYFATKPVVEGVKKFKDEVKNNKILKENHQILIDSRLLFILQVFVVVLVCISCFIIYAVYDGKFRSLYENNVTIESPTISCPTVSCPAVLNDNKYDFKLTTNVTVDKLACNCFCGNNS